MARLRNKIPELMKQRGMTQTELHRATVSLSWPTVFEISSEARTAYISEQVTFRTLLELADALGVQVTDLYEREGDNG